MRKHESLYREAIEQIWNRGNLDAADQFFAEDYVGHDPLFPRRGGASLRDVVRRYREAISELSYEVHEVLVDGDRIAARWTVTGRHTGELFGVKGTGRPLEVSGMSINRIEDGRIAEGWVFNDTLSMLRQLEQEAG
jgi:steroid delta-isomerase-like uncharacterized protein